MPGGKSGLDLVPDLVAKHPGVQVVVLTGYGSIATAVEAVRKGAINYLSKPADTDQILAAFETDNELPTDSPEGTPSLARVEWEHIQRIPHRLRRQHLPSRPKTRNPPPKPAKKIRQAATKRIKQKIESELAPEFGVGMFSVSITKKTGGTSPTPKTFNFSALLRLRGETSDAQRHPAAKCHIQTRRTLVDSRHANP